MHDTSGSALPVARLPRDLPLRGVTVVSCEQAVAAPFATRQLADLGARVIKIERPGRGDFARDYDETVRGMSSHFVWLNRSKESVALDLKDPSSHDVMAALLERADVFVQNLVPGAADRLGLGAAELRARWPRLITCSVSGYGTNGPLRDAKAYDLLIQSEAGLVSITGTEAEPAKTGIPAADIAAGMYAFSGILTALYDRQRTNVGTALDISLFDALVEWMGYPLYYTGHGGNAPQRTGTSHAAIAPYGTFRAGDGTDVVLSVQNEREWEAFCSIVLDDSNVSTDPRFATGALRVRHREELDRLIHDHLVTLTGEQFQARLEQAAIAHARQRDLHSVLEHPQLSSRGRWRDVDSPVGHLRATLPPICMEGVEPRMDRIPAVGEHTEAVLAELGLSGRTSMIT
ncbi:CaiB/BaiF CoA-transferase family protein [Streptomyces malaysiensis subsp. malaysiensis]|uniref:CaiB/BaiF CoA transferase family protein n=1 Tax=Streptomyces malaysiensis TaxID=92644 RepID=UPI0024C05F6E|nr:CaiB/BaiF CoA-transferase family protein [Streptomyces sp. NA07423]WHX23870.1 CaiB/BaiF CoA-transferase family protein [Streptomyces sp. NA07423]